MAHLFYEDAHDSTFETLADSEGSDENEHEFQFERSSSYVDNHSRSFTIPPSSSVPRIVARPEREQSPTPTASSQSKTLLVPDLVLQTQRRGRQMPIAVSTPVNKPNSILRTVSRNDKIGSNQRGRSISPYVRFEFYVCDLVSLFFFTFRR